MQEHQEIAVRQETGIVSMIERLARDTQVDVIKFEKLVLLQADMEERQEKREAEKRAEAARVAYCAAFAKMQAKIPAVVKNKKNDHTKQKYANLDAILEALREPLGSHGFSISHKAEQTEKAITVHTILRHEAGHSETQSFTLPIDTAGSKNIVQAIGSSSTYAARYGTCRMLGIASEDDDDGKTGGASKEPTLTAMQKEQLSTLLMAATEERREEFREKFGDVHSVPVTSYDFVCAKLRAKPKQAEATGANV